MKTNKHEKETGIWIDGTKAIIVTLTNNTQKVKTIKSEIENKIYHNKEGDKGSFQGGQHVNNEKRFEERRKHQLHTFLSKVTEYVKGSDALYIFGPAEAKIHLKKEIENDRSLAPILKAVESSESMSRNQLIAKVKNFYKEN